MAKGPMLTIPAETYTYIKACVKKAGKSEVGGLGIIVVDEDGYPFVAHHRLLKQKVSSGEVEWDESAHSDYLEWLYKPEEDGGAGFDGNEYGLYSWHSHGHMSTFYSNTDEDFIRRVGFTAPYIFSSVFNTNSAANHRLDAFIKVEVPLIENERTQITWKDCQLYVQEGEDVRPLLIKIGDIEERFDAAVKALKEEKDAEVSGLRKELTELQKGNVKQVEDEVDADFDKYVELPKSYSNPTWPKGHQRQLSATNGAGSGGASDPKAGSSQGTGSQSPSSPKGHDEQAWGDKESETKDSDDTGDILDSYALAAGIIMGQTMVNCYDITAKRWGQFSISDISADDDLVPGKAIPEAILDCLPDDIHLMLALRPTYSEWVTGEIQQLETEASSPLDNHS